jgi:hypothetical protein
MQLDQGRASSSPEGNRSISFRRFIQSEDLTCSDRARDSRQLSHLDPPAAPSIKLRWRAIEFRLGRAIQESA